MRMREEVKMGIRGSRRQNKDDRLSLKRNGKTKVCRVNVHTPYVDQGDKWISRSLE